MYPAGTHKGQVSFSGGHMEPGETAVETAVREFREEMWVSHRTSAGLYPATISVIGQSKSLPSITQTMVRHNF